jgi:hypothetical protein
MERLQRTNGHPYQTMSDPQCARQRGIRMVLLCVSAVMAFHLSAFSQGSIAEFAASFKARGRTINDLVVDPAGNVHVAWTTLGSKVHDAGTLFYTRLDGSGRSSAETQITKYGGIEDIRIDINSRNEATLFYVQLKRLCFALFDGSGSMQTEMDRMLTPEETDARFEFSRDEGDNIYLFGRGAIDYFWVIDHDGKILQERRGRWVRQATPGFLCHILNPLTLLLVWCPKEARSSIRTIKFDLSNFSHGEARDYDLGRVAEAKDGGSVSVGPVFVRSGKDLLLVTTVRDSSLSGQTYRVRFNARGEPVRRWETKRIYHVGVNSPKEAGCPLRVARGASARSTGATSELVGLGRDGNIYHLKGNLPALRAQY